VLERHIAHGVRGDVLAEEDTSGSLDEVDVVTKR
jgi:hypothetical protein